MQKGKLFLLIIILITAIGLAKIVLVEKPDKSDLGMTKEAVAQATVDWPMAGANPARTSWTSEGVKAASQAWKVKIKAFIPHKVQIVAAGDLVYISAADGVHALRYDTGAEAWVYKTTMPVGHSPTIAGGTLYVGVFDKKIHAVNAVTGVAKWTFTGEAGFDTNPLVIGSRLYTGGRDGYFYALNITDTGATLAWKYKASHQITYSAAYSDDGVLYFADKAGFAYALNASDGSLKWKSERLPGTGFFSYWPVVYGDRVIFAGSHHYSVLVGYGGQLYEYQRDNAWPAGYNSQSKPLGPYVDGRWIDASFTQNYLISNPSQQTVFVLNRSSGAKMEVPPILWNGNESPENRYPPAVSGQDNNAYFFAMMLWTDSFPLARIIGWKTATPSRLYFPADTAGEAGDKPGSISTGGKYAYSINNRGHRLSVVDVTAINSGANVSISTTSDAEALRFKYGHYDGDTHGLQNGPVPFRGKVYLHQFNHVYAFKP